MGIKLTPAATDSKKETFAFCLGYSKRESDIINKLSMRGRGGGGGGGP